mmetsp:Transcript_15397/g.46179  ORF Transcript_15397/g.46179 Transcript_15397/m.46179 type:complete len:281 (-) Transcript_15397:47-889(-)
MMLCKATCCNVVEYIPAAAVVDVYEGDPDVKLDNNDNQPVEVDGPWALSMRRSGCLGEEQMELILAQLSVSGVISVPEEKIIERRNELAQRPKLTFRQAGRQVLIVQRMQKWLHEIAAVHEAEHDDRVDLNGVWKCTDTWGMDDFLSACGIGRLQRMAATNAPWPWWEFKQSQDHIMFINHGPMGDVLEQFVVNGPNYIQVDGRKQEIQSKAVWQDGKLVIERSGPQGKFRELREIDADGKLQFSLQGVDAPHDKRWGRTFVREAAGDLACGANKPKFLH